MVATWSSDKEYMSDKEYVANIPNLSNKKLIDGLEWCGHDSYYNVMYYPIVKEIKKRLSKERTAKVVEHDASITDTDGYKYKRTEYLCTACKKRVIGGDNYCSHCGARLEWDD